MYPTRHICLAAIVAMSVLAPLLPALAKAQGAIANGAMATGAIFPAGDVDAWTFEANAGDAIVVRMGQTGLPGVVSLQVKVVAPGGATLGSYSSTSDAEVAVAASVTGTYSIVVSDDSDPGVETCGYRLTLAKTGTSVVVSSGDEGGPMTNGVLHTGFLDRGDLDVYTVDANAGDVVIARMGETTAGSALWPWLRIFGPPGTTTYSNNAGPGATEVATVASVTGTYLVLAAHYQLGDWSAGSYRLTLAKTGAPVVVSPGDEGGPLASGASQNAVIEVGDLDLWTIDVPSGAPILVTMEDMQPGGGALWPQLRVYGPTGAPLTTQSGPASAQVSRTAPQSGTYLIVAGDGNSYDASGPYRLTLGTTLDTPEAPVASALVLAAPSPNPFTGRTVMRYSTPAVGRAVLSVYDLQGRLVRTLVDEASLPAGAHDAAWDGRDAAGAALLPGLYLARLEAAGPALTRKLLLAR